MKIDDSSLKSGPQKGRTLKWIFFHDPGYARQLIAGDNRDLTPGQQEHLISVVARATHLRLGICRRCKKRPVTRMGVTISPSTNTIDQIYFVCDECDYSSRPDRKFFTPSLLLPAEYESTAAYRSLQIAIKEARFGDRRKRMTASALNELFTDPSNKLFRKGRAGD